MTTLYLARYLFLGLLVVAAAYFVYSSFAKKR
jgi:hypothetical protein